MSDRINRRGIHTKYFRLSFEYVHWRAMWRMGHRIGFFRNRPGVVKWIPGQLLPRRWGIYICGLEIGSRG